MTNRSDLRHHAAALAVIFALVSAGCGGAACATTRPPEHLSPVGDAAWYARQAAVSIGGIVQLSKDAHESGVLSDEDYRKVLLSLRRANEGVGALIDSVAAGLGQEGDRSRNLAVIRQALAEIPDQLPPRAREKIEPLVSAALAFLSFYR